MLSYFFDLQGNASIRIVEKSCQADIKKVETFSMEDRCKVMLVLRLARIEVDDSFYADC